VAIINSIIGGVGLALITTQLRGLPTAAIVSVGVAGTLVLFAVHLLYGHRRLARFRLSRPDMRGQ
jgi:hypothetical protein